MDYFVISIFVILIIFIIYYISYKYYFYDKSVYLQSNEDNKLYLLKNTKNKYKKVEIIDKLVNSLYQLLDYLESKDIKINESNIKKIKEKLKDSEIMENLTNTDTSYTINKGEKIIICLADRKTDKLYDYNLLIYVLIHELAHIMNSTYGHDKAFKKTFRQLVDIAEEIGIYKYEDYHKYPKQYCGMLLNTNIK